MRQIANDRNENAELRRDVPLARKPFAARSAESLSTNDRAKALGGRTPRTPIMWPLHADRGDNPVPGMQR